MWVSQSNNNIFFRMVVSSGFLLKRHVFNEENKIIFIWFNFCEHKTIRVQNPQKLHKNPTLTPTYTKFHPWAHQLNKARYMAPMRLYENLLHISYLQLKYLDHIGLNLNP